MRFLLVLFSIFCLFLGCAEEPVVFLPPDVGDEVKPPAVPEPEVDTTFMNPEAVEAWRAGIAAHIETDSVVPHPRDIWRYATDFHVDRSHPDPILGDPSIWDAAKVASPGTDYDIVPVATPRPDEARALEDRDEEWEAAQLWIVLNRLDDAQRCSQKLEEEGEWKAVATIAVHTGDLKALDRATARMVNADQISRTKDVAIYAFLQGKYDIAKRIATIHGWNLSEVISPHQVRELALQGDTSVLLELLDREIVAWEKGEQWALPEYPGPQIIVADIAILAKTDPTKAKEYAARYLRLPYANVLIWTRCGEGCYSQPVSGSLELYQMVCSDQELRELYLARLRTAVDEMFPLPSSSNVDASDGTPATIMGIEPGNYGGWSSDMWGNGMDDNQLTAYLQRVRQMNDRELTAFWVAMLDTFPNRYGISDGSLDFERELGRCALGLPFYQSVGNITPIEKFILEELSGGANTRMDDTWAAWDQKYPVREQFDEVAYLFSFLTRGDVSHTREAVIRTELGIQQVLGEETDLRKELNSRFRQSLDAHYGNGGRLNIKFGEAGHALRTNATAKFLRVARGLPAIDLYPDTDEELAELMAPSIELLCQKLPAKCQLWPGPPSPAVVESEPATGTVVAGVTTVSVTQPTNCTFVNGNRPQLDDKYIVRCDTGIFLATGEYKGGGVYDFFAFTAHTF